MRGGGEYGLGQVWVPSARIGIIYIHYVQGLVSIEECLNRDGSYSASLGTPVTGECRRVVGAYSTLDGGGAGSGPRATEEDPVGLWEVEGVVVGCTDMPPMLVVMACSRLLVTSNCCFAEAICS